MNGDSCEGSGPSETTDQQIGFAQRILIAAATIEQAAELDNWLRHDGHRTVISNDGTDLVSLVQAKGADLIVMDSELPSADWMEICTTLRQSKGQRLPVLLLTNSNTSDWDKILSGLAIGETKSVNDYLIRPFNAEQLRAKVKAILKINSLHHELCISNSMLKELTNYLDGMVDAKTTELENVNRLRRFFSPQIVEAIISENSEKALKAHRGEITVVFLDMREFTSFAESHSPQEVFQLVHEFHETVGPIIFRYGGTLERFTGDGIMVFLGDPRPMPDHPYQAIRMALHIQYMISTRKPKWIESGYKLGLGIGIATGEAIMGSVGFERRYDYAAIGNVTNLAARLCGLAVSDQILISEKTYEKVKGRVKVISCGKTHLKGFSRPSVIYAVQSLYDNNRNEQGE